MRKFIIIEQDDGVCHLQCFAVGREVVEDNTSEFLRFNDTDQKLLDRGLFIRCRNSDGTVNWLAKCCLKEII